MANIRISQLPTAPEPISGSELVPIVQSGQTVQTTIANILSAPTLTQTFITLNQEPTLPNSRYIAVGSGLNLTDGGAQSTYSIGLTGAISTINTLSNGVLVKSGSTVISRSIAVSGSGLSVSNGDGVSGNPTIALTGNLLTLASASGSGLVAINGSSSLSILSIIGTTNQISVANGNGVSGSPTIAIATDPVLPGNASVTIPAGSTSARPTGVNGMLRYNSSLGLFEGFANNAWGTITTGTGVTSVGTGTGLTGGPITSTGTISIADTGVTAGSYTYASITVNAQGQITSATNGTTTVSSFSAGTTGFTPSTATTGAVTLSGTLNVANGGTGATTLTGYVYGNGTSAMTASTTIPTTALSGTVTNAQLANSSITLGTTTIALGGTSLAPTGLTSVTVTQDPSSALQLATKQYVDAVAQGLDAKASVVNASTTAYTATYANGTAGVGATLTNSSTLVAFSADGVTNSVGDRVLIKNQGTSAQNGIYTVTTAGSGAVAWVLTRATDMDTWAEVPNSFVFVESGTINADTGWVCTSNAGGTMGTTAITWVQFSGAGTYTAGTGLTLTGTQFSLTAPVTTALGGTGITTSPTAGAIVYGATTSTLGYTAIGTSGQPLLSAGAGTPTFGTLSVGGGGTGITTLTAGYIPYGAGTSAFASVSTFNYNTTNNTLNVPTIGTTSTTSVTPSLSFNGANSPLAMGATVSGSYLQVLAQNKSGTAGASVNYVLSNDLGTDSTYYGEFGMNSSVFSASTPADFFSINNGIYFSSHDGDVTVGSGNGFKTYLAWGATGASAHVINAAGAIGLNTNLGASPATSGTTNFGTAGQVMISSGSSATPVWGNVNGGTF